MRRGWVTVRARTTLLASAATAVALVLGAVILVTTLQSQLTSSGDALARARVGDLLSAAESGNLPRELDIVNDETVLQALDEDGDVIGASANIMGRPAISRVDPGTELRVLTIDAPDDDETERYRVWVAQGPSPSGTVTVLVGTSLESVTEAARTLRQALVVGVPALLLLLALAIWWFVGRALSSVDKITRAVETVDEAELHRRVPVPRVDDEVGRLASTMNRMLDRLEESSVRHRRFVADASHDLQSPLASQRAQLEVALAHPGELDVTTLAGELIAVTSEMEQLVRDLLYLAVQDEGGQSPDHRLFDLDDIVLEEAARARSAAGTVAIDTREVSAAPLLGDLAELRRLVRNLLDNAARHAATEIRVRLAAEGSEIVLDVIDDGPGVPELDWPHIFDRFYRSDTARERGGGSGLGLAIALGIARRHGGDLRLVPSAEGTHFQLRVPVGRSSAGAFLG